MPCKHEANPQGNKNSKAQSQQSHFATLLKSHPCTGTHPKIPSTSAEHPPPGEHLWQLLLHVKRILKDLNYTKFLFIVVKGNPNFQGILDWILQILHYYGRKQYKKYWKLADYWTKSCSLFALLSVYCDLWFLSPSSMAEFLHFLNIVLWKF